MNKMLILLGLLGMALFGNMYAGEINDEFGAEVIDASGTTGQVIIRNNEANKDIWVALFPANVINLQSITPILIAKTPALNQPITGVVSLTAKTGQETVLAVWYKKPAQVTVKKGMFFGYNITPKPDVTHTFTLSSDKNIFFGFNNGRIQEKK